MIIGNLIIDILHVYSLLIIARAVTSWINLDQRNQIVRILNAVTDPVLIPIQKIVPPIGGSIDISPIIAFVLIQFLEMVVSRIFW